MLPVQGASNACHAVVQNDSLAGLEGWIKTTVSESLKNSDKRIPPLAPSHYAKNVVLALKDKLSENKDYALVASKLETIAHAVLSYLRVPAPRAGAIKEVFLEEMNGLLESKQKEIAAEEEKRAKTAAFEAITVQGRWPQAKAFLAKYPDMEQTLYTWYKENIKKIREMELWDGVFTNPDYKISLALKKVKEFNASKAKGDTWLEEFTVLVASLQDIVNDLPKELPSFKELKDEFEKISQDATQFPFTTWDLKAFKQGYNTVAAQLDLPKMKIETLVENDPTVAAEAQRLADEERARELAERMQPTGNDDVDAAIALSLAQTPAAAGAVPMADDDMAAAIAASLQSQPALPAQSAAPVEDDLARAIRLSMNPQEVVMDDVERAIQESLAQQAPAPAAAAISDEEFARQMQAQVDAEYARHVAGQYRH